MGGLEDVISGSDSAKPPIDTQKIIIGAAAAFVLFIIVLFASGFFYNAPGSSTETQTSSPTVTRTETMTETKTSTQTLTETGTGTQTTTQGSYGMMAWASKIDVYRVVEFNSRKAIIVKLGSDSFKAFYSGCLNASATPSVVNDRITCTKALGGQGSKWNMSTGALLDGPATKKLEEIVLRIEEDRVLGLIS